MVDDFSDLIKTDLPDSDWGSISDLEQQQGLSFGIGNSDVSCEESPVCSPDSDLVEQPQDSVGAAPKEGIANEKLAGKQEAESSINLDTRNGAAFTDVSNNGLAYEEIQSSSSASEGIMVVDEYFEEVKPTLDEVTIIPDTKLDSEVIILLYVSIET